MNINFTARHTEITLDIKEYCERRLSGIEKLLGYPVEVDVILSVEKYRHKAEINIKTKGSTLNTIQETTNMLDSLGVAFDHIEKRVKKEREKLRERKRKRVKDVDSHIPSQEEEEQRPKIIRSRDYSLKPMSVDEALFMLQSNRKDILMFRKFDTEKWTVLYRRKDGHFGLIEPE